MTNERLIAALRQIEQILLDSRLHLNGRETQILRIVRAVLGAL